MQDLVTRPVLVNMVAKTVPQLRQLGGTSGTLAEQVNSATLYELYISFWLKRDDWRSNLDVAERRALFLSGETHLHYFELLELLASALVGELFVESSLGRTGASRSSVNAELCPLVPPSALWIFVRCPRASVRRKQRGICGRMPRRSAVFCGQADRLGTGKVD